MKLDNIIYDVNSLQQAIAQQWSADSEVFASIYPSDTAAALINGMASYGSLLQYTIVSALANCYTSTAFSEAAVYQLADTLGNDLHGNVSSQVIVNIRKNNFIGINTTIPAYSTFEIKGKRFFNPHAIIIPATTDFVHTITLVQGEIIEVNKTTSGIENEKFYFSSDFKASPNYIHVYIDGAEWSVVDSFLGYDKAYVLDAEDMNSVLLKTDPDGRSYVKVGNGQLATLPLAGSILQIKYCSNDGALGNISETGVYGNLTSKLVFVDSKGNEDFLDVEVITTTTAYGGFSKQSLETLKYTSPYVFASGHRCIRRQDYNAMLQNKCGYITSQVWGEYEQANKVGAYDSLMMNMVYYTGVKTFETYPYFKIDPISNPAYYNGALYSNSGFYGSYSFRVSNTLGSTEKIYIQDTGGQGFLFINDNNQDPRDSLLPDWIASTNNYYANILGEIVVGAKGLQYRVNDELYLQPAGDSDPNHHTDVIIRVTEVNEVGAVNKVELLTRTSQNAYQVGTTFANCAAQVYYKKASQQSNGSGLIVQFRQYKYTGSTIVSTNDLERDPEIEWYTPIINARSDKPKGLNKYYKSAYEPTLQEPVQIRLTYPENKAISGIKFQAVNPYPDGDSEGCPFIGTVAMFGTTKDTTDEDFSYYNIRNSDKWDCIINRKELTSPWTESNSDDHWTDWIATNSFGEKDNNGNMIYIDENGNPVFKKYKNFVIEFYSTQDLSINRPKISFNAMKILYGEDSSEVLYTDNGEIRINLPTAGSPGPGGTNMGYLTSGLVNSANFPMYAYDITLNGITEQNGYRDGDTLSYVFKAVDIDDNLLFNIQVASVANAQYITTVKKLSDSTDRGTNILVGTEYITMSSPAPLSDPTNHDLLYTYTLDPDNNKPTSGNAGSNYAVNDIITIKDKSGNNTDLTLRVAAVNSIGEVLALAWLNNTSLHNPLDKESGYTISETSTDHSGTGLKLVVVSARATQGSGATILIKSNNNLEIDASFTGNRIDTADVNYYDEPIIKEYNHFTTYLEFVQPEIIQQGIRVQVAVNKSAKVTSGIVLQNVRNNILKLFEITPDYISKGIKLSDIYKAVTDTENVAWCKVLKPTDNVAVNVNGILVASDIVLEEVLTN